MPDDMFNVMKNNIIRQSISQQLAIVFVWFVFMALLCFGVWLGNHFGNPWYANMVYYLLMAHKTYEAINRIRYVRLKMAEMQDFNAMLSSQVGEIERLKVQEAKNK